LRQEIAVRIVESAAEGRLIFTNPVRDLSVLRDIAAHDSDPPPLPTLPLLAALDYLARKSSRHTPMVISSLVRPLRQARKNEPHGNGQAVDILAFAGYEIRSSNPSDCEQAALALILALEPGAYRLGLPMPAGSEPIPFLDMPDRRYDWPFFPPPLPETLDGIVLPKYSASGSTPPSLLRAVILDWADRRYAPIRFLQSHRVRAAIESAKARGANIHSLFPDGTDHIHLDVKP
jgi:hypothetical protein